VVVCRTDHPRNLLAIHYRHVDIADDDVELCGRIVSDYDATWHCPMVEDDSLILPIVCASACGPSSTQTHRQPILVKRVSKIYNG
jgi:hypothetical protein